MLSAPVLFVISGMQGAGKSTVAELLAHRFERSVYIPADTLQRMIVSGGRWPGDREMSAEAERQLRLRLHNMCLLGRLFQGAGFMAVLDDIIIGERVEHLIQELQDRPFAFVMLQPRLDVVEQRERKRGTRLFEAWAWMDDEVRARTRRIGLWLDTSEQTADETVDEILRRYETEGVVPAGPSASSR